ncbi:hypothetical protein K501DRAFT_263547, partial [Backusella circina FSU 941]
MADWIGMSRYEDSHGTVDEDLRVYCFSMYHHQRWRFSSGWCDLLSTQDPPVWSDVYLEQTPSTDQFHL